MVTFIWWCSLSNCFCIISLCSPCYFPSTPWYDPYYLLLPITPCYNPYYLLLPVTPCYDPYYLLLPIASLVAHSVKNLPAMHKIQVQSLGEEDPLEKRMVIHSRMLAWRIP